jgi:succinate-semialdehyde dehydrogenase/glutarate-semialdehyde dehydrogenase
MTPQTEASPRPKHGLASINPATGETLREFEILTPSQVEEKLARATDAFRRWRQVAFAERAAAMTRAAEILEREQDGFGRIMTAEMGKPLEAARQEAAKCARACRYYAERAEALLADRVVETSATRSFIRYQPLGPVLAVMPWNFPFWQVFRFAAPGLVAGNVGLLKHASNVPQCALAIEDIFSRAGFPAGVFQTLLIGSSQVEAVLRDPRVVAATLTGSEGAGASVASIAGREIKKTVLELGGSDPFVVMPSADLDRAASVAVQARTINNGQSCIAAKRFIVHEAVYNEFERRFVPAMRGLRVGDPMDERTQVGPLATEDILRGLDDQVRRSVEAGARLLCGGHRLDGRGFYYAPTVLADIPRDAPARREEMFGPAAALIRVRDAGEAIQVANETSFGLGASVWTRDDAERRRLIDEIEAGMVFVNAMVSSDPRVPFGGVKRSGYGRELGEYGILEFLNIKTAWIGDGGGVHRTSAE